MFALSQTSQQFLTERRCPLMKVFLVVNVVSSTFLRVNVFQFGQFSFAHYSSLLVPQQRDFRLMTLLLPHSCTYDPSCCFLIPCIASFSRYSHYCHCQWPHLASGENITKGKYIFSLCAFLFRFLCRKALTSFILLSDC